MSILRFSLPRRRHVAFAVLALAACLSISVAALAAQPKKGATYSGTIRQSFHGKVVNRFPISFRVAKTGKQVRGFTLPSGVPFYCQGGGFGTASGGSGSVKAGKFKVSLPIIFAPTHQHQGFVTITGTFHAHNRESGRVTTRFTKFAQCGGTSPYATTAR